jgi:hypothetical protein
MVVALIALFVALGGSAAALSGSNTVFTDDITDNNVYSADVRNDNLSGGGLVSGDVRNDTQTSPAGGLGAVDLKPSSVGTSEITNGTVSVLDTNKVIPSGATVTGAFYETDDTSGYAVLHFAADFHGLRAPTALTDNNITFDDIGISAAAAASSEENPGCTGGLGIPTAPPGEVCIYLFGETVDDGTAIATPLSATFPEANDKGFHVRAESAALDFASLGGVWAYQAP